MAQVPISVQQIMSADHPADGKMHTHVRGRLKINLDTFDCVVPIDVHPALKDKVPGFYGVGPGIHVGLNKKSIDGRLCDDNGVNQVSFLSVKMNNYGKPYKVVLAVWQGGAVWIGIVERAENSFHHSIKPSPLLSTNDLKLKVSISRDIGDLINAFSDYMSITVTVH